LHHLEVLRAHSPFGKPDRPFQNRLGKHIPSRVLIQPAQIAENDRKKTVSGSGVGLEDSERPIEEAFCFVVLAAASEGFGKIRHRQYQIQFGCSGGFSSLQFEAKISFGFVVVSSV
jgi:hypothetical protein